VSVGTLHKGDNNDGDDDNNNNKEMGREKYATG
jgi:hypothetical protein